MMWMRTLAALGVMTALTSAAFGMEMPEVYKKKCMLCHSIGGEGGKKKDVGGPLDGVGKKRDEAWMRAYFAEPKSKIEDAKMPKIKMSPEELDLAIKYMLSLQ
jgi:hypothetical protein